MAPVLDVGSFSSMSVTILKLASNSSRRPLFSAATYDKRCLRVRFAPTGNECAAQIPEFSTIVSETAQNNGMTLRI
jgi:hypothetical protein